MATAAVVGGGVYLTAGGGDPSSAGSPSASTSITPTTGGDASGSDADAATDSEASPSSPDISFPPDDAVTGGPIGSAGSTDGAAAPAPDQAAADGAVPAPAPAGGTAAACADQSLAIKAIPDNGSYTDGSPIGFTVAITNISTTPCERDLGSGMQQVLVYTLDDRRLWSSLDCFPAGESDVRILEPGQQAKFTVQWSGATSEPGCQAPRTPVGAGDFEVIGQLGDLKSSAESFRIV